MTALSRSLLRRILTVLTDLAIPPPPGRAEKKRAGLKYCRWAGYGHKWFRGRRVPDLEEQAVMGRIVELRVAGASWYRIAAQLLREGVRTKGGAEWSVARVRRAHDAELRRRQLH